MEGEHRRADHDDEIVLAQCFREVPGRSVKEAGELRMAFGERAARRERAGPDRGHRLFRNFHHQLDGLRAIDGGTDDERRVLALGERCDERLHCRRIGPELAADVAWLDRLRRVRPVIDRHRDEGRPARWLHRHVIGARDRGRHIFGARRLDAVFHIRLRKLGRALGIEKRQQRHDRARLLAAGDDERRLVAIGVENVAHRIADAGRRMQIDKTGVAGRLRVAVGHADDGGLMQAEHVVDVIGPVVEERQFGRAGIAEHFLDAEGAEQRERRVLHGDRGSRRFWLVCGTTSFGSQD